MNLILGSSSAARVHLLEQLGVVFKTRNPNFDERSIPFEGDPAAYCKSLALQKNLSIPKLADDEIVITCDTVVYCGSTLFNKPLDYQDALSMLSALNGQKHQVLSGICVSKNSTCLLEYETTWVEFNTLDRSKIEKILEDPQFLNRSGAYTIRGYGALLVKSIQGSYENVIGLPLNTLEKLLNKMDESLWD